MAGLGAFRPRRFGRRLPAGVAVLAGLVAWSAQACPACTAHVPEPAGRSLGLLVALGIAPLLLVGLGIWAAWWAGRRA
ncbi:hypothetical protein DRW03_17050 [Corallococcus sp. H22C18031201]|uniref:hypothetical protein n=1 Tax=Citreicoccus inhibens TaxID=2849499 RepID=UPI000EDDCF4E|nr:hypothetical protein [Citreicoccus inhibens]MBU8897316.1 hypothetical protein [Citreicoccus inhibens]RJS21124.1 hypothetical protein DRW03_17050 [Corallococcus sp. H22C18031201]